MSPDVLRYAVLAGALVLCLTSAPGLVWAPYGWGQRVRFGALIGYGVVTSGGQLNNIGNDTPLRWTTWVLAVTTVLAIAGSVEFLYRHVPTVLAGEVPSGRR